MLVYYGKMTFADTECLTYLDLVHVNRVFADLQKEENDQYQQAKAKMGSK
jgi:hypothetical protein